MAKVRRRLLVRFPSMPMALPMPVESPAKELRVKANQIFDESIAGAEDSQIGALGVKDRRWGDTSGVPRSCPGPLPLSGLGAGAMLPRQKNRMLPVLPPPTKLEYASARDPLDGVPAPTRGVLL